MKRILVVLAGGLLLALAAPAHPASAHPLGNFSVNQLDALDLYPDRVQVTATVDVAELPTLQERSTVDSEGSGYAAGTCTALGRDLAVTVSGHRLQWTVRGSSFGYHPGAAGLDTSRLDCVLDAPARLSAPGSVDIQNRYRADRIGWRELTAAGHGVALIDPPVPAHSVSDGLRAYPKDLLSSPLSVRSATLTVRPGSTAPNTAAAAPRRTSAGWTARAEQALQGMVGGRRLGPLVGVLAVLLAIALGAGHAVLPGHGKTVMAAYLAGRDGRPRDALVVGATVTATHTGGVLLLGLLLTSVAGLAGETVLGWLGVASGLLVAIVGGTMLVGARRRRAHEHHHQHGHEHHHGHEHPRRGRLATVGMGIAGGLVPSPSALVILLGAIGLGRTAFGVLLVLGYGLGMAATLAAAGLVLIRLRDRWARRGTFARWTRLTSAAPTATATLVLLVGLGLAARSL